MSGRGSASDTKHAIPKASVKKDSRIRRSLGLPPRVTAIMLTAILMSETRATGSSVRVRLKSRMLKPSGKSADSAWRGGQDNGDEGIQDDADQEAPYHATSRAGWR